MNEDLKKSRAKKSAAGFTLMELIVVMVILGMLAAVVGPRVYNSIMKGKDQIVKIQLSEIESSLMLYSFEIGHFPSTAEGLQALIQNPGLESWKGPYLSKKELPKDPWERPYIYKSPGDHNDFDLSSAGADGIEGNEDDICSWK
jgi:general secretion pathway protein G